MTDNTSVAVSSRIRLARNIHDWPFPAVLSERRSAKKLVAPVSNVLAACGYKIINMGEISELERRSLIERYIVSKNLAASDDSAVAINRDGSVSVLINEEDHVREQCIVEGFDLYGAFAKISALDRVLGHNFRFAMNSEGYLTACPSNLGTGMRASVMLFLPALSYSGEMQSVLLEAREAGITVRGAFGEGSAAEGDWYQVSNARTRGRESEIISAVHSFVTTLIENEEAERLELYRAHKNEFEDKCLRAYGILNNCTLLEYGECVELVAKVKLGCSLGIIKLGNPSALDGLLVSARPSTLTLDNSGSADERLARANIVRGAFSKII